MDEIKKAILDKSTELFMQRGCRTVSIDEICAELRMSKKTFYQYFSKKEILIEEMLYHFMQAQKEFYQKHLKDKNAIDTFIFTIKQTKKNAEKDFHYFWSDLKKYYPTVYRNFEETKGQEMKNYFTMNINQGIKEGYFRDDLDVEMLSFFHSVQIRKTFEIMNENNEKFSSKRVTEFFIDLMIHLIANEKGLKYIKENYKE